MAVQIEKDIWDAMQAGRLTVAQGGEVRELRSNDKTLARKIINANKLIAAATEEREAIKGKIEKLMGVKNEDAARPATES